MKDNVLRKKTNFETLEESISSVHVLKESKKTKQELDAVATIGLCVGDVYYVEADGMDYAWTGTTWDAIKYSTEIETFGSQFDELFKRS